MGFRDTLREGARKAREAAANIDWKDVADKGRSTASATGKGIGKAASATARGASAAGRGVKDGTMGVADWTGKKYDAAKKTAEESVVWTTNPPGDLRKKIEKMPLLIQRYVAALYGNMTHEKLSSSYASYLQNFYKEEEERAKLWGFLPIGTLKDAAATVFSPIAFVKRAEVEWFGNWPQTQRTLRIITDGLQLLFFIESVVLIKNELRRNAKPRALIIPETIDALERQLFTKGGHVYQSVENEIFNDLANLILSTRREVRLKGHFKGDHFFDSIVQLGKDKGVHLSPDEVAAMRRSDVVSFQDALDMVSEHIVPSYYVANNFLDWLFRDWTATGANVRITGGSTVYLPGRFKDTLARPYEAHKQHYRFRPAGWSVGFETTRRFFGNYRYPVNIMDGKMAPIQGGVLGASAAHLSGFSMSKFAGATLTTTATGWWGMIPAGTVVMPLLVGGVTGMAAVGLLSMQKGARLPWLYRLGHDDANLEKGTGIPVPRDADFTYVYYTLSRRMANFVATMQIEDDASLKEAQKAIKGNRFSPSRLIYNIKNKGLRFFADRPEEFQKLKETLTAPIIGYEIQPIDGHPIAESLLRARSMEEAMQVALDHQGDIRRTMKDAPLHKRQPTSQESHYVIVFYAMSDESAIHELEGGEEPRGSGAVLLGHVLAEWGKPTELTDYPPVDWNRFPYLAVGVCQAFERKWYTPWRYVFNPIGSNVVENTFLLPNDLHWYTPWRLATNPVKWAISRPFKSLREKRKLTATGIVRTPSKSQIRRFLTKRKMDFTWVAYPVAEMEAKLPTQDEARVGTHNPEQPPGDQETVPTGGHNGGGPGGGQQAPQPVTPTQARAQIGSTPTGPVPVQAPATLHSKMTRAIRTLALHANDGTRWKSKATREKIQEVAGIMKDLHPLLKAHSGDSATTDLARRLWAVSYNFHKYLIGQNAYENFQRSYDNELGAHGRYGDTNTLDAYVNALKDLESKINPRNASPAPAQAPGPVAA